MRVLLIDGDVLCHCIAAQQSSRRRTTRATRATTQAGGTDLPLAVLRRRDKAVDDASFSDLSGSEKPPCRLTARIDAAVAGLKRRHGADAARLAFSEPPYWRAQLYPAYKAHRRRPPHADALAEARAHCRRVYDCWSTPGFEADDGLGLWLTEPSFGEERVCWSTDKDLLSVPGLHARGDGALRRVTAAAADRRHLLQTLTGDAVDGYPGCPGVGPKTAAAFLDAPYLLSPSPPAASSTATPATASTARRRSRARKTPTRDVWAGVLTLFAHAGVKAEDALVQAQVARIIRHGERDRQTGAPRLWRPERLAFHPSSANRPANRP